MTEVDKLIEFELQARDDGERASEEPEVAFTVRLPVAEMALLEQLGAYLGYKKTRFAAMLLRPAVEDAFRALIEAEGRRDRMEELREHFDARWELEDGAGWVHSRGRVDSTRRAGELGEPLTGEAE